EEAALLARSLALPALKLVQTVKLWPSGGDAAHYVDALAAAKPPVLTRVVAHGAVPLARLADAFPKLEHLSVGFHGAVDAAVLPRFVDLRSLELSDVEATPELALALRAAPWKKLKRLRLRVYDLHGDDLKA